MTSAPGALAHVVGYPPSSPRSSGPLPYVPMLFGNARWPQPSSLNSTLAYPTTSTSTACTFGCFGPPYPLLPFMVAFGPLSLWWLSAPWTLDAVTCGPFPPPPPLHPMLSRKHRGGLPPCFGCSSKTSLPYTLLRTLGFLLGPTTPFSVFPCGAHLRGISPGPPPSASICRLLSLSRLSSPRTSSSVRSSLQLFCNIILTPRWLWPVGCGDSRSL